MVKLDGSPIQHTISYADYERMIHDLALFIMEDSTDYSKTLEKINSDIRKALDYIKKNIDETYK